MYQAFIIEDEAPARSRIKKMLLSYPKDIEVLGEADQGKAAIEQIESLRPAVLFLDIQLPDMTGFELLAQLTYQPLVIFTTAYESYAIQAFETYSIDYLVKPFDAERLKKAIEKLKKFGANKNRPDYVQLEKLISQPIQKPASNTLALKLGDRIILLDHEEISYLKAEDKYARIYLESGKKHLSSQSLESWSRHYPLTLSEYIDLILSIKKVLLKCANILKENSYLL